MTVEHTCVACPRGRDFEFWNPSILANTEGISAMWLNLVWEKKKKKIPFVCFSILKLHFISKLPMFLFLQNVNMLIIICVLSKINWPSGLYIGFMWVESGWICLQNSDQPCVCWKSPVPKSTRLGEQPCSTLSSPREQNGESSEQPTRRPKWKLLSFFLSTLLLSSASVHLLGNRSGYFHKTEKNVEIVRASPCISSLPLGSDYLLNLAADSI